MRYEPVIGLEIHVQLKTRPRCSAVTPPSSARSRTHISVRCALGSPGRCRWSTGSAVELGEYCAARRVECTVHETSIFARKNYFYPDLPKGYQITQYDRPLATDGHVDARVERGATRRGECGSGGSTWRRTRGSRSTIGSTGRPRST